MKKIITKFWGVALIVMLLSTLFVAAAPVSAADPLTWNTESIPGTTGKVLLPSHDVASFAVGNDGTTIYAVSNEGATDNYVFKSTNAGVSWTSISNYAGMSTTTPIYPDFVAVAADSADVAIIANASTGDMRVTTNGGNTWSDLSTATMVTYLGSATITSIAVSAEVNGIRYAAVSTSDGEIYTRKFGSSWEEWVQADTGYTGYLGTTAAYAVQFSPNFQGDRTLVAVTDNGSLLLEVLVFGSTPAWNAVTTNYPAQVLDYQGNPITDADGASLALSPDYPGAGEVESIAFIGVRDATTATSAGVYRMDDYISSALKRSVQIYSVAFDGSVVVAGTTTATVWRSENPLDASPTFAGNSNMKGPGGSSNTLVAFAGGSVVAGTSGTESAFSVSTDNGRSFNDISLIDTTITDISDVQVNADGTIVYLLTSDAANQVSLFRYNGAWQRVLSEQTAGTDWIVRINPANPDSIYVADTGIGSTEMYYSSAGGDTRWYGRTGPGITDLAVESDSVVYAAIAGGATVSKSTNAARFFNDPVSTKLGGGTVANITVLSENNIIVGSSTGYVAYSTDGNSSWTAIPTTVGGATIATATGLTKDSYVYASLAGMVYMWTIGQETTKGWTYVGPLPGNVPTTDVITGMVLNAGTLYASTTTTFTRNTMPWLPELGFVFWSSPYSAGPPASGVVADALTNAPSALRLSTTTDYVKVWAAGATSLYSYMDTLAMTKPTGIAPAEGALIPLNVETGLPYNITFTWTRPSMATSFTIMIALDPFFTQTVIYKTVAGSFTPTQSNTLTTTTGTGANDYGNLGTLIPGTTYYWTVMAAEPLSSGMSAMPGTAFTVEAGAASVPSIASPINGAVITNTLPAFSWSPVTGTTMYMFELSDSVDFSNVIYTVNTPVAGAQVSAALGLGTYFWRVKSLEPVESAWSTIANFTVAEEEAPATQQPDITITIPPVTSTVITVPPATTEEVNPAYIWAIIIIGAVLVIAVIVLIVRTRRSV